MTYYVNKVYLSDVIPGIDGVSPHKFYVGLFTNNTHQGEGTCCGWYGSEKYIDTTLIGFYQFDNSSPIDFKKKLSEAVRCNIHFDEISIGSAIWECILNADSDDEAFEDFSKCWFSKRRR